MRRKTRLTYEIDRKFYFRLALYIALNAIFITLISYFSVIVSFFNDPRHIETGDSCSESETLNNFLCWLQVGKESNYFDVLFYTSIALLIFFILGLLVLNTTFIANKFYFIRYIRENSYGAVIYRIRNNEIEYLIEEMSLGHVSLCKGHSEKGEKPEETALREIEEETSLAVQLDTAFTNTIIYHPNERAIKYVTFFVAESINNEAEPKDLHDKEVTSSRFVSLEEALFNVTYDDDRETLIKANKYLLKKLKKQK